MLSGRRTAARDANTICRSNARRWKIWGRMNACWSRPITRITTMRGSRVAVRSGHAERYAWHQEPEHCPQL